MKKIDEISKHLKKTRQIEMVNIDRKLDAVRVSVEFVFRQMYAPKILLQKNPQNQSVRSARSPPEWRHGAWRVLVSEPSAKVETIEKIDKCRWKH